MSCAAAIAALQVLEAEKLPERANRLGELMHERLLRENLGIVRGRGAMCGLDLGDGERAFAAVKHALNRGLLLLPSGDSGEVISLTPPLNIEEAALVRALDILVECVRAV